MNYFAHAWPWLQKESVDPYFLAGLAVPDWLSVAVKKTKCRTKHAEPYKDADDSQLAHLAQGIMQHHSDDGWFHESAEFNRLSLDFAKQLRQAFGEKTSMRPWFLGHILVELLLDAELVARQPSLLEKYYQLMSQVDADWVATTVEQLCGRSVGRLGEFIPKYIEMQFLGDYGEDASLTLRLNQVMRRVGLPALPDTFASVLPSARKQISSSADLLIAKS